MEEISAVALLEDIVVIILLDLGTEEIAAVVTTPINGATELAKHTLDQDAADGISTTGAGSTDGSTSGDNAAITPEDQHTRKSTTAQESGVLTVVLMSTL